MQYKYVVLTNTTIGTFMALLDSNIVLISLPTIIRDLPGTTTLEGIWIILGYVLVTASLLLTIGRLADLYGRVRLYNIGFAVFTIGSGLCSLSPNGQSLVLFRLVQGIGAGLLFANSAAILTDAFPVAERGRALGLNQVAGTGGALIGLVAGGVLTAYLGWQSIFWINVPVGVFATIWAYTRLKELGPRPGSKKLDPAGNLLFAGGLSLALLGHAGRDFRLGDDRSHHALRGRRVPRRLRADRTGGAVSDDGPRLVPKQGVLRRCREQPPRVDRSRGRRPRPRLLLPRRARPRRTDRGRAPDPVLAGLRQHRSRQRLPLGQVRPPWLHHGRSSHFRGVVRLVRDASVRGLVLDPGLADDPRGHRRRPVHRPERGVDHELGARRASRGRRGHVVDALQCRIPREPRAGVCDHGVAHAAGRDASDLRRASRASGAARSRGVHGCVPPDLLRDRGDQPGRGDFGFHPAPDARGRGRHRVKA